MWPSPLASVPHLQVGPVTIPASTSLLGFPEQLCGEPQAQLALCALLTDATLLPVRLRPVTHWALESDSPLHLSHPLPQFGFLAETWMIFIVCLICEFPDMKNLTQPNHIKQDTD